MNKPSSPKPGNPPVSAERYRNLVESIQDYAILMLDTGGHVLSWNPGAEAIKGYTADEIIGSHFARDLPAPELKGFQYHFVKPINENVLRQILTQVAALRAH
jgi:PAS domain S-box-containing protein